MKRLFSLVVLTAVMAATIALSSAALADPSPPSDTPGDSGNPSCFGEASRSAPGGPGPGAGVSEVTTGLTGSHGVNLVDDLAREVGLIQEIRSDVCPTEPFPEPEQ